jgi:hypothetical protein
VRRVNPTRGTRRPRPSMAANAPTTDMAVPAEPLAGLLLLHLCCARADTDLVKHCVKVWPAMRRQKPRQHERLELQMFASESTCHYLPWAAFDCLLSCLCRSTQHGTPAWPAGCCEALFTPLAAFLGCRAHCSCKHTSIQRKLSVRLTPVSKLFNGSPSSPSKSSSGLALTAWAQCRAVEGCWRSSRTQAGAC